MLSTERARIFHAFLSENESRLSGMVSVEWIGLKFQQTPGINVDVKIIPHVDLRGFLAQNIGQNSFYENINQMIDFSNILVIGVFEPVDSEFFIKFFEKCQLKGVKCNYAKLTIELSDLLVIFQKI